MSEEEHVVDVDLTDIKYIGEHSKVRLRLTGKDYEFRPISAATYYDYLTFAEDQEYEARAELIYKCMLSPKMTLEQIKMEDIGIFNMLFEYLFNYSFLKKIN